MKGKLYGVGVGPGDPEFLTLKAIRILKAAEVVVIPEGGQESLAYEVVKPYLGGTVLFFLPFSMTKTRVSEELFVGRVAQVREFLEEGKDVAFVTLGDPLLYSTFVVLWRLLPEVEVEIVPGVSAFQAAAAKLRIPLAQGKEKLAVVPGEAFQEEILKRFETLVVFKVARYYDLFLEALRREGFSGGLVSWLGWEKEVVSTDLEGFRDRKLDYFSLLVARREKP